MFVEFGPELTSRSGAAGQPEGWVHVSADPLLLATKPSNRLESATAAGVVALTDGAPFTAVVTASTNETPDPLALAVESIEIGTKTAQTIATTVPIAANRRNDPESGCRTNCPDPRTTCPHVDDGV
jgi:hypothetical protein